MLTSWEAEFYGRHSGRPDAGEFVNRALKVIREKALPKTTDWNDSWRSWVEGAPISMTDAQLDQMISEGRLPSRAVVKYEALTPDKVDGLEVTGSHVIIYLLQPAQKTKRRISLSDLTVVAQAAGWRQSLKRGE